MYRTGFVTLTHNYWQICWPAAMTNQTVSFEWREFLIFFFSINSVFCFRRKFIPKRMGSDPTLSTVGIVDNFSANPKLSTDNQYGRWYNEQCSCIGVVAVAMDYGKMKTYWFISHFTTSYFSWFRWMFQFFVSYFLEFFIFSHFHNTVSCPVQSFNFVGCYCLCVCVLF